MIRISALSNRDSFLDQLKLLGKNFPEIILFYLGCDICVFNKQYLLNTDIILIDSIGFDPLKAKILSEIKLLRPDILIMAFIDFKVDTDITAYMSSRIDGIIPHYVDEKDLYSSLIQLYTKRKFIHPDFIILVFDCFQTLKDKRYAVLGLKPKSLQVLDLLSKGYSYQQIADELDTTIDVIRYYIKDIYSTLNIKNKVTAINMYLRGNYHS